MAWFKVDDQFWSHPKVNGLSSEAGWLWTRAGSYCGQHLTDGLVSRPALAMLQGTEAEAAELVESGLWIVVDGGWQFHDWTKYQPTRDAVLQVREARAEAGRKGGLKSGESRRGANAEANALANGQATGKQKRTPVPSPVPSPSPIPTSDLSNQSGLVTETRASVILDRIDPKKIHAQLKSVNVELTDAELAVWADATLSLASRAVKNPTGYLMTAIRYDAQQDGGEIAAWIADYRRHRMKAVNS